MMEPVRHLSPFVAAALGGGEIDAAGILDRRPPELLYNRRIDAHTT